MTSGALGVKRSRRRATLDQTTSRLSPSPQRRARRRSSLDQLLNGSYRADDASTSASSTSTGAKLASDFGRPNPVTTQEAKLGLRSVVTDIKKDKAGITFVGQFVKVQKILYFGNENPDSDTFDDAIPGEDVYYLRFEADFCQVQSGMFDKLLKGSVVNDGAKTMMVHAIIYRKTRRLVNCMVFRKKFRYGENYHLEEIYRITGRDYQSSSNSLWSSKSSIGSWE